MSAATPGAFLSGRLWLAAGLLLLTAACAGSTTSPRVEPTQRLETNGDVGFGLDMELDVRGNPVITHLSSSTKLIRVIRCEGATCEQSTRSDLLSVGRADDENDWNPPIRLRMADDLPVIASQVDWRQLPDGCPVKDCVESQGIRVVSCTDPNCTDWDLIQHGLTYTRAFGLDFEIDGSPVLAEVGYELAMLRCSESTCETPERYSVLDTEPRFNQGAALQIAATHLDGSPLITIFDPEESHLQVVRCPDAACSVPDVAVLDKSSGISHDLAIDQDGNPVVVYEQRSPFTQRLSRDGLQKVLIALIAATLLVVVVAVHRRSRGERTLLALVVAAMAAGPLIAAAAPSAADVLDDHWPFLDRTEVELRVLRCTDPACAGSTTISTVHEYSDVPARLSNWDSWVQPSIAIDGEDHPVVSFQERADGQARLMLMRCLDPECTEQTVTVADSVNNVGKRTSLELGSDDNPIIAYQDAENLDLMLMNCDDPFCSP